MRLRNALRENPVAAAAAAVEAGVVVEAAADHAAGKRQG
jgi:hypothetical protein